MADAGAKVLRGLLDVFLLESIEGEPKHGYALLREMATAFGTEPNRNRLYPLLGRMVRDGLIAERSDASGARTLYALTDAGREALTQYRQLPPAFKDRLTRIWAVGRLSEVGSSRERSPAPTRLIPVAAARTAAPTVASTATPAVAPATAPAEALPYPCVDARVGIEKDPRSGDLSVKLTGCPMGAYEYCPLCPVYQAVDGIRKLTFS